MRSLHLEPLFPHGREYEVVAFGKRKSPYDVYAPEGGELLVSFLKALDVARGYGIKITNGHLAHFTKGVGYFCGAASGKSMMVTHDGFLSACLETVDAKDKDFGVFVLGRYLHERDLPYCRFTRALVPILVKRIATASAV